MQKVSDSIIPFDQYMKRPKGAENIKPASSYASEVIDLLYGEKSRAGYDPPWIKAKGKIRIRPGELSIFAGANGSGKSLLNSLLMLWAMKTNKVCIASLEMTPAQTMKRMVKQAAGVESPSNEYIEQFHKWTNGRLWIYDQQTTVDYRKMIALGRYVNKELGIQDLVIDSLMRCGIGVDDYNTQKKFVDELATLAKSTGMHIHLVCHTRKKENDYASIGKNDIKGASEISDLADNVYLFTRNKKKELNARLPEDQQVEAVKLQPDAFLAQKKNRHGDWEGTISLWYHGSSLQYIPSDKNRPMLFEVK